MPKLPRALKNLGTISLDISKFGKSSNLGHYPKYLVAQRVKAIKSDL